MKKLIILILVLLVSNGSCFAQNSVSDQQEKELLDFINGVVNGLVNSNTLFTSQEAVSSGLFKLDSGEDGQLKFNVMKIPFRYSLCDDKDAVVRPYIRGMLGQANQTESPAPVEGATGLSDFSGVYTYSASLGGGVNIKLFDHFTITPDFAATYSRIKNKYHYHNEAVIAEEKSTGF